MNISSKMLKTIKNPWNIIPALGGRGMLNFIPDELYLKATFRAIMNKKLNLVNPKTFNEKLQWLKINYRDPRLVMMVDKYKVREYIEDLLGKNYLVPLLGVWDKVEDIDFELLPNKFVLKCTHDSGSFYICKDKNKIDINMLEKKYNRHFPLNFYCIFFQPY